MLANSLHRTQCFCLNRHCLKKNKKRYRELAALVASGRKLGSWGWAWERDFSKGKDFQREKIFKVFTFLYLQTLELCCSYLNKI